jgi:transcriptional activator protein Pur-alpha
VAGSVTFSGLFQVKSNFRTAITVPEKCWTRFRDILNDYCEKMSESATTTADNNTQAAQSSAPNSAGGSQK